MTEANIMHDADVTRDAEACGGARDRTGMLRALRPYRWLFEVAREGLIVFGPDGRTVDVNQSFADLSGYTRQELLRMRAEQLCGSPDGTKVLFASLVKGAVITHPVELRQKDGTVLDCLCTVAACRDGRGRPVFYCGALHLVRELKMEVESLKASEQKYRLLFQQSIDAVALVHPDGLILDANPSLLTLFGLTQSDIGRVGMPEIYFDPSERPRFVQRLMTEGGVVEDEARLQDRKGRRFDCARTATVVRAGDGAIIGFQVLHRDVTEQRRAEKAARKSQKDLRRLAARLEETREDERKRIARELHDQVGQALTTMKFEIARIRHAVARGSGVPIGDLERLEQFVDGTVDDVRRISSELRPGMLDDLGLSAAMEWQLEQFQLRTGIASTMEDTTTRPPSESVSTALYRVFQELLTNVARHSGATAVAVGIGECVDGHVLTVSDNGRGITRAEHESGASLGLIGIRERLLPFGGNIELHGEPGKGTRAVVRVPR